MVSSIERERAFQRPRCTAIDLSPVVIFLCTTSIIYPVWGKHSFDLFFIPKTTPHAKGQGHTTRRTVYSDWTCILTVGFLPDFEKLVE